MRSFVKVGRVLVFKKDKVQAMVGFLVLKTAMAQVVPCFLVFKTMMAQVVACSLVLKTEMAQTAMASFFSVNSIEIVVALANSFPDYLLSICLA